MLSVTPIGTAAHDPLQDTEHADSYPLVTRALILVTVLEFVLELQARDRHGKTRP
jgi:hypothetical protein